MATPLSNQIIREITPLSDKDCFYIAERYKTEFTYRKLIVRYLCRHYEETVLVLMSIDTDMKPRPFLW